MILLLIRTRSGNLEVNCLIATYVLVILVHAKDFITTTEVSNM